VVDERREGMEERVEKEKVHQAEGGKVDVDVMVGGIDENSKKILELAAGVCAGDDLVYYIDRAIIAGTVGVEDGIREVRRAGRGQFLKKAWMRKIGKGVGGKDWELR